MVAIYPLKSTWEQCASVAATREWKSICRDAGVTDSRKTNSAHGRTGFTSALGITGVNRRTNEVTFLEGPAGVWTRSLVWGCWVPTVWPVMVIGLCFVQFDRIAQYWTKGIGQNHLGIWGGGC